MADTIASLDIQISASANNAVSGLSRLTTTLNTLKNTCNGFRATSLTNSLNKIATASNSINISALQGLSSLSALNGVKLSSTVGNNLQKIAESVAKIDNSSITKLERLADAINKLGNSNSKGMSGVASALNNLGKSGRSISGISNSVYGGFNLISKGATGATKSVHSLAFAFGKFYANCWLIIRAFRMLGNAINLSSQLTELQNVVDVTFGDMKYKVEDLVQDSIKQFGMSELSLKQFASRFQAMGNAMGIPSGSISKANAYLNSVTDGYVGLGDSMADVSLTLTKLTADMASFYDVEQSAVAEDLEAILTGMTRPLRTYGLDLTEATLKEWALKNGIDANIKTMSQAEKTMLRYQYVLANTVNAQGDFARTSGRQMCRVA